MDAVAFPPPPAPLLDDDDFDFGDFTFASAPAPTVADPQPATTFAAFEDDWGDFVTSPLGSNPSAPAPTAASTTASWEKPRGPLPLSLFGADDDQEEDEGPAAASPPPPPPKDAAHQRAPSFTSSGSRPADLKDLIAGLYYGSQLPSAADAIRADAGEGPEDDDGFGDDGWEFKAAATTAVPADLVGGARGDGIGKIEDISKSSGSNQEDWSPFTGVNGKLNHVHTTDYVGNHESTGESLNPSSYSAANNSSILNLYKESELGDATYITQISTGSTQSSSDLFSNNKMNSSFETDENHSIRSTSDSVLIEFYHRLREESLTVISNHVEDLKKAQRSSTHFGENSKAIAIGKEIQEIYDKLEEYSLPKGFCTDEHPTRDVSITELLKSIKEEHLKDFEQEYHLAEKIAQVTQDVNVAVELYRHSVSTLHILKRASKEERCDYVCAWQSLLLSCAQEMQHGGAIWQESCRTNICDQVISEGGRWFIALGEIYRVAQILYFSLQHFKSWILADPGMLSKMLASWESCSNAWTSGLQTALTLVAESTRVDASVAKALMLSIEQINELEVSNLQDDLPNNEVVCRLTLLPASLVQGMKMIMWNGDHYFVKVANLWANRISSHPPQLSWTLSDHETV